MQKLKQALQLQQQGKLQEAENIYRQILKLEPGNIHCLNLLGAICVNSARPQEAVDLIGRALEIKSEDAQALFNFALGLKELGRYDEAIQVLQKALSLNPQNIAAMNSLGSVLFDSGAPLKAIPVYQRALELKSDYIECWCNLSMAFRETRQFEPALSAANKAIEIDAKAPQVHSNLAELYRAQALFEKAIQEFKIVLQLLPGNSNTMINLANTYREADRPEEGKEVLQQLLRLNPENAEAHNSLGYLQEQSGDREAAAESFQKSILANPKRAIPHYRLAQLKGRKSSEEELATIHNLLARTDIKNEDRRYLFFALAVASDKEGHCGQAFEAWQQANNIEAKKYPYDALETQAYYRSVVAALSTNSARLKQASTQKLNTPLFIIGMPRSGTTLTGQILASHSCISSLGEISFAYDMAASIVKKVGVEYPEGIDQLSLENIVQLGREYTDRYPESFANQAYLIDNTPLNFPHIGLLGMALPNAKFIHCVRDPIDTCFSIYKLPFAGAQTFAHDLEALGIRYSDYWELMNQWKTLLPDRILDVQYEETVADIEAQSRRIFHFLDLPYEDSVLDFHKSKDLIRTPSASQVREPIYKDAVRAWKKYEAHLGPLIESLNADLRPEAYAAVLEESKSVAEISAQEKPKSGFFSRLFK